MTIRRARVFVNRNCARPSSENGGGRATETWPHTVALPAATDVALTSDGSTLGLPLVNMTVTAVPPVVPHLFMLRRGKTFPGAAGNERKASASERPAARGRAAGHARAPLLRRQGFKSLSRFRHQQNNKIPER